MRKRKEFFLHKRMPKKKKRKQSTSSLSNLTPGNPTKDRVTAAPPAQRFRTIGTSMHEVHCYKNPSPATLTKIDKTIDKAVLCIERIDTARGFCKLQVDVLLSKVESCFEELMKHLDGVARRSSTVAADTMSTDACTKTVAENRLCSSLEDIFRSMSKRMEIQLEAAAVPRSCKDVAQQLQKLEKRCGKLEAQHETTLRELEFLRLQVADNNAWHLLNNIIESSFIPVMDAEKPPEGEK